MKDEGTSLLNKTDIPTTSQPVTTAEPNSATNPPTLVHVKKTGMPTLHQPPLPPAPVTPVRRGPQFWFWLLFGLLILAVAVLTFILITQTKTSLAPAPPPTTIALNSSSVVTQGISGTAALEARADTKLTFNVSGTVSEITVKPGDTVQKDQVLAKLDNQELQNNLSNARSRLELAQSELAKLKAGVSQEQIQIAQEQLNQARQKLEVIKNGTALPAEIQSARSAVTAAKAKLDQLHQGVTPAAQAQAQAQISAAQASVTTAQAKLDKLLAGPIDADINAAQLKVNQAQANLDKVSIDLYKKVVEAQLPRDQALIELDKANETYKQIYSQNHSPDGVALPGLTPEARQKESAAYQFYQEALNKFNKADSTLNIARTAQYDGLRQAEIALSAAQLQLDQAKAGPSSADLSNARAVLDTAKASLDKAKANLVSLTPTASDLSNAQAQIDEAEAKLAKLTTGGTAAQIAQTEAEVRIREAALQDLQSLPRPQDVTGKQNEVQVRQAEYDQAVYSLSQLTLKAPFAGTLSSFTLLPGQTVKAGTEIGRLIDASETYLKLDVRASEIAKIHLGQPVTVNFKDIAESSFTGQVSFISPEVGQTSGVNTYPVLVVLDKPDKNSLQSAFPEQYEKYMQTAPAGSSTFFGYRVPRPGVTAVQPQPGMSAALVIALDVKVGVLSVPNELLKTRQENGQVVQYVTALDANQHQVDRMVTTGLQGNSLTEITGGALQEGDRLVVTSSVKS
jgi:HlyD family secretion protein